MKIDGIRVFSTNDRFCGKEQAANDVEWRSIKSLLKTANSAFSHSDRYQIVRSLAETAKSFTDVKSLLGTSPATTNFHLKTLTRGMIVYKDENGKYALTLMGELVLGFFSNFLEEALKLQKELPS